MKTKIIFGTGMILAVLFFSSKIYSQSLTFSSDSVIAQKCDNTFSITGIIKAHNNTSNPIALNWVLTQSVFPGTGWTALIIDPDQFPPNATGGTSYIQGNDSTDILFHVIPDAMMPGDTAIFQIMIFNPLDSNNTVAYLTALIYCPSLSAFAENVSYASLQIFPNPFSAYTVLQINNYFKDAILLLDNSFGQTVKKIKNISGQAVTLSRDNLPGGLYFVRLIEDSKILATKKLLIID